MREFKLDESSRSSDLSDLINALKNRAPRTALAIAAGQAVKPAVKSGFDRMRERLSYTMHVSANDEIYDAVHTWVLSLIPVNQQRSLAAFSVSEPAGSRWVRTILMRYDGRRESVIRVNGHQIRVSISEGRFETEGRDGGTLKPPELELTARSAAGRDAVINQLRQIARDFSEGNRRPVIKMYGDWGWENLSDSPARSLDSVILPDGQVERIVADMQRFLDAEEEYVRRGIPWHRGYLFEGPPRTGKTSIARALASHFNMDLWYFPLGDIRKDGELLKKIAQVSPRSILLLEDVDIFAAATQRTDGAASGGGRATLAGLLNATDGAATPHGLITVMTSNEAGKLDSALTQSGRVDLREHFSYCTREQGQRIICHYFDVTSITEFTADQFTIKRLNTHVLSGATPADVVEACKRSDTPVNAVFELANMRGMPRYIPYAVDVPVSNHAELAEPFV